MEHLPVTMSELGFRGGLDIAAQAENDAFARDTFLEQCKRVVQSRQPRRGIKLQHQRRVVTIQHQAGPAVAFAVNEAIAGGLRIEQIAAAGKGLLQPCLPPRAINRLRFAGVQNPHPDRRVGIEQTYGEETVLAVVNHR